MKILFFALLFFCVSVRAEYFQHNCTLFDEGGKILRTFPGAICVFNEDGSVVSAGNNSIRKILPDDSIAWSVPFPVHHQMNSGPKGSVVAIGSEIVTEGKLRIRYDEFISISHDGKIRARNSFRNLGTEFIKTPFHGSHIPYDEERSHFNSIFEVTSQISAASPLKEGSFVVNSLNLGTFILSSDMKVVLDHIDFPGSENNFVHDVRPLEDGTLLYFNNTSFIEGKEFPKSAVQILDVRSKKVTYTYDGNGIPFMAWCCGGAQKLDGDLFVYTIPSVGLFMFSRRTGKVVRSVNVPVSMLPVQNMRVIRPSRKFLREWGLDKQGRALPLPRKGLKQTSWEEKKVSGNRS